MPTYEYRCNHCYKVVEKQHSMDDTPVYWCKDCGVRLVRILSPTAGWVRGSSNPCRGK